MCVHVCSCVSVHVCICVCLEPKVNAKCLPWSLSTLSETESLTVSEVHSFSLASCTVGLRQLHHCPSEVPRCQMGITLILKWSDFCIFNYVCVCLVRYVHEHVHGPWEPETLDPLALGLQALWPAWLGLHMRVHAFNHWLLTWMLTIWT